MSADAAAAPPPPESAQWAAEAAARDAGRPHVAAARRLLSRACRVTLNDGRALEGRLHCVDKQGSVILTETVETLVAKTSGGGSETLTRTLGMVLVPERHRAGFEADVPEEEALAWMSLSE